MKQLAIIGASGHAKVIIDIVEKEGKHQIAGLIDRSYRENESVLGYPVIGRDEALPSLIIEHKIDGVIIAIGDNYIRSKVAEKLTQICCELKFFSAIHPTVSIAKDVLIGDGTVIMAGVSINSSCEIGCHCILNTNSSLDHDATMADFSSLAPGGTIGGNVRVGKYSAIGIGATIIHNVNIGEYTVIGAGSTVLKDTESLIVAYGSPAKMVRKRKPEDRYL